MTKNYLSPEAYRKLQEELEMLKTVKRKEIALKIQEAKELGDLSENAAYQEAKDAQAALETRILDLELLLKNSTLIKPRKNSDLVEVGSQVTVQSLSSPKTKKQFLIIGAQEADPAQGKISNESPLGKAFLGHRKGEVVIVKTPKGEVKYKIVDIN